ncbi:hypothetical protein AGMMS50225_05760 [Betaproteobacteria bacterium]|nr:hypothetical protein AGMMS50225_05760 [Betaproteobacteria bacterium]
MSITPPAAAAATVQTPQEKSEPIRVKPAEATATDRTTLKHQLNVQILEASANVSIAAGDKSQALLFRSAIDHINELLAPELGPNAIQNAVANGVDTSAEATAERIVSLSTGFYEGYARQHPGVDPEKLATDFVNLIRGGFEKGYGEAQNILEGLGVFDGEVKSGVQKTFELVQKGYDDFLAGKLDAIRGAAASKVAS